MQKDQLPHAPAMGKWQPAIVKLLCTHAAGQRLGFIKKNEEKQSCAKSGNKHSTL
jgi:hypothetical protein